MLVLSMKTTAAKRKGPAVSVDGVELIGIGTIRVLDSRGGKVRLGFEIRPDIKILRLGLGAFEAAEAMAGEAVELGAEL
ncbi:MAG: hypothetical protein JNM43_07605 [Planctomycetaceae bacterium]|nr:hypothetical protein [Planctomycetaceae bacterium]